MATEILHLDGAVEKGDPDAVSVVVVVFLGEIAVITIPVNTVYVGIFNERI